MDDAVSIQVDPRGFVRTSVVGPLTDEILRVCSQRTRALPEFQAGMPVLLDFSGTTSLQITTDAVVALGKAAQKDTNRFAILAPQPATFGMARMYEIIGDLTESRIGVYQDEQSAIEWLNF
jgi:hypothetical protein